MKIGWYSDSEIPKMTKYKDYQSNSFGYRCPEFSPLPDGGKNVIVVGCSHTFAEGLEVKESWVELLSQKCSNNLRWWNLGYPGASGDFMVRVVYGSEKVLFPKIIICCWPLAMRRERLDQHPKFLYNNSDELKIETEWTDKNNFYKNLFFIEKFADFTEAKTFHCFAEETHEIPNKKEVYTEHTLRSCWPEWDSREKRDLHFKPNVARDGMHYGDKHHMSFADKLFSVWGHKLK